MPDFGKILNQGPVAFTQVEHISVAVADEAIGQDSRMFPSFADVNSCSSDITHRAANAAHCGWLVGTTRGNRIVNFDSLDQANSKHGHIGQLMRRLIETEQIPVSGIVDVYTVMLDVQLEPVDMVMQHEFSDRQQQDQA